MPTINQATLRAFAADPAAFRASLVIDCDGRAVRFDEIAEPRQRADFAAADPGWRQAIGLDPLGEPRRLWSTRPRGSSKTTDAAVALTWAMAFAPIRATGIAASGDFDQCKILALAVQRLLDWNLWLCDEVTDRDTGRRVPMLACQGGKIRNGRTGAETIILSADAATSYGHLADWLVIDEIANWPDSGEKLWISLASTIAKRPRMMTTIITNAGFLDSWQRRVYDAVTTDPRWHVSHWDSPAAWMSQALLDEQRALLPAGQYARLFENRWSTGSGDAIDESDIAAAITLPGPPEDFSRVTNERRTDLDDRRPHFAGLDLSVRRDHSALVVLAADPKTQRVALRYCRTWKPGPNGVDLAAIRTEISGVASRFKCGVFADPFQAALMIQDLTAAGVTIREVPFVGAELNSMATAMLSAFRDRRIALWNEPELIAGLRRLNIVERSFGVRLEATRDSTAGHCDAAIALSIALPRALEAAQADPTIDGTELFAWIDELKTIGRQSAPIMSAMPSVWRR